MCVRAFECSEHVCTVQLGVAWRHFLSTGRMTGRMCSCSQVTASALDQAWSAVASSGRRDPSSKVFL